MQNNHCHIILTNICPQWSHISVLTEKVYLGSEFVEEALLRAIELTDAAYTQTSDRWAYLISNVYCLVLRFLIIALILYVQKCFVFLMFKVHMLLSYVYLEKKMSMVVIIYPPLGLLKVPSHPLGHICFHLSKLY